MDRFKKSSTIFLVVLLALLSVRFLLQPGYFPMHDDTQPTRISQMYDALRDGQFPVRWVDDLGYGYGYPIFNFYAPFPYYVGAGFMFLGMDAIIASKILFIMGAIGSAISMYLLGSYLWGRLGGLVSSILYVYFPYHAVQLYVRGALGEYFSYAILPLVFLGILKTKEVDKRHMLIVSGVGLAGIILSHNISGMLTVGMLSIWLFVESTRSFWKKTTSNLMVPIIITLVMGISISTFFWLPALFEASHTRAETLIAGSNDFRDHFVYLDQLWDSPWGYAGSAPGRLDGMSFKIGKLHLFFAGWVILGLFFGRRVKSNSKIVGYRFKWLLCSGIVISIIMLLSISLTIWNIFPFLAYVQYPWRFLALCGFFLSISGGGFFTTLETQRKKHWIFAWLAVAVIVFVNLKNFTPKYISDSNLSHYTDESQVKWDISKISDEYMPFNFPIPQTENEIRNDWVKSSPAFILHSFEQRSNFSKMQVSLNTEAELIFAQAMFPGWTAVIDTQKVPIMTDQGLMKIAIPSGDHLITFYFQNTLVRSISNMVSLGSVVIYGSLWYIFWKQTQQARG